MASLAKCCTLLALAVSTTAFQTKKGEAVDEWNPMDIFRAASDSAQAPSDVKKGANDMKKRAAAHVLKVGKLSADNIGNKTKPRLLVHSGCDASEAIMIHARAILALYGIVSPQQDFLTLHDNVSHILLTNTTLEKPEAEDSECGESCRAMIQSVKHVQVMNQSLLFKANIELDHDAIFSESIKSMGTLIAFSSRKNKLDQVVCMVKDCYLNHQDGYPVVKNKKSDLCWDRRAEEPQGYKAFVKPNRILENIMRLEEKENNATEKLRSSGYSVELVTSESLLDFEWNKKALDSALKAWAPLLKSWGVRVGKDDEQLLETYLKENAGKGKPPKSHKSSISNFADIKKVIDGRDRFSWMLRE